MDIDEAIRKEHSIKIFAVVGGTARRGNQLQ
jgi:hypothetical protein